MAKAYFVLLKTQMKKFLVLLPFLKQSQTTLKKEINHFLILMQ